MRKHAPPLIVLLLAGALLATGAMRPAEPVVPPEPVRFVFQPESTLRVEGTSTVHDWTCEASGVTGFVEGTSVGETDAVPLTGVSQAEATVPVRALDCDNGTMNRKMRDALDIEDHPMIRYELEKADLSPQAGASGSFKLQASGQLTIAGATRPIEMTVAGEKQAGSRFRFTGQAPLDMTEFGVDPPSALLGTLKTGEKVTVHFDVVAAPSGDASAQ